MNNTSKFGLLGSAIILFVCLIVGCGSCHRVDQGNVGLLVELTGTDKGEAKVQEKSGWVFVTPFVEKLFEYPTFQQHKEYEEFAVLTKGGLQFDVKPVLNYQIDRDSVVQLFKRYRLGLPQIEDAYMRTTVTQVFRDVTNTFDPDSLINNRSAYEAALFAAVSSKLKPYFTISQITSNLTPPESLIKQIQNKAAAIQEAQAAENQVKVVRAQGEQHIAQAKFDSAQKVIHAAADAKVNEFQQKTLTPLLVEKMRIEKWNGAYPQVIGAGGSILNLGLKP
jgi:regulator of protease activity HflC (stomatin/prohibitin superfamily)